jgi:tetratricopeptide (TPR) repeat protein
LLTASAIGQISAEATKDDDMELGATREVSSGEDLPDWLKGITDDEPIQPVASQPMQSEAIAEDLAGGLLTGSAIGQISAETTKDVDLEFGASGEVSSGEGLPDWLKGITDDEPIQPEASQPIQSKAIAQDLAGGFLTGSAIGQFQEETTKDSGAEIGTVGEMELEEDIPDWLKEFKNEEPIQLDGSRPLESQVINQDFSSENPTGTLEGQIPTDAIEEIGLEYGTNEKVELEGDLPDWLREFKNERLIQPDGTQETSSMENDQDSGSEFLSESMLVTDEKSIEQPVDDISAWLEDSQQDSVSTGNIIPENIETMETEENFPDWLKDFSPDNQKNEPNKVETSAVQFPMEKENLSIQEPGQVAQPTFNTEDIPEWLKDNIQSQEEIPANLELTNTVEGGLEFLSEEDQLTSSGAIDHEELNLSSLKQESVIENLESKLMPIDTGMPSLDDQDAALAWLESLAAKQGAKPEELLTKPEDRLEEPPEWVQKTIVVASSDLKNEELIAQPADAEFIETIQPDKPMLMQEEEFATSKFPTDVAIPEVLNLVIETPDLKEELLEEGLPQAETKSPEITSTTDSNVADWLKEMDARDASLEEDLVKPEVGEFYGNEASEPLPDWLKEMEKGPSSEGEELPDWRLDSGETEIESEKKEIEDIGDIFPTDSTEWIFEEKEPELDPELISEIVKPVEPGDWRPILESEQNHLTDPIEISTEKVFTPRFESSIISKLPGTGMLSKIPTKEKDSDSLERAQLYLQQGDFNLSIIEYGRMIKKGHLLEEVIHDLREMIYQFPIDIGVWQTLGDAYMRANQLQEALDAYTKAEELLR